MRLRPTEFRLLDVLARQAADFIESEQAQASPVGPAMPESLAEQSAAPGPP